MDPYLCALLLGFFGLLLLAASGLDRPGRPHGLVPALPAPPRAAARVRAPVRRLLGVLLGAGGAGVALRPFLDGAALLGASAAAAAALEWLLLARLWREVDGAEPAPRPLAVAVTGFDAGGRGVVALELDGRRLQVRATLAATDRAAGVRVQPGDTLLVEEVDGARNRCVVCWSGAAPPPS